MARQNCWPSRLWSRKALPAPTGIGGVYSVETSIGSQAAACADSRRKDSASRLENLAICAADFCGSRYSARVEPSSNTDIIGDSGNR